jgi:DNA-binding XRE family transcriptional regulator
MNVQLIERDGKPEWAVLPYAEYEHLMALLEDMQDAGDAKRIMSSLDRGEDEALPQAVAQRLLNDEAPLRVWREYRGLTQTQLAEMAGVTQAMVTMIETGRRKGQTSTLKRLADALGVDVDDLVAPT